MATELQILEALNTKEAAVPTADLAKGLNASTEGTRKQLVRLKAKNQVGGDSQEGWLITDAGKEALEQPPSMIDEGVTPRQKFEAIAQRIGIKEERIALAADIVWSGDYQDLKWVWEALGQADIRDDLRKVWVNAWRAYLHKGIPPELEFELTGLPQLEAGKPGEGIQPKASARDFIILDEQPVRVGQNLGDYSLQDAKDILAIRALRGRFGGAATQAGAGQGSPGASEKVSEVLTALAPYLNKGTDTEALKEMLADKLEIQRRDILSQIPQGQSGQPKSGLEQFVTAITSLKEVGPTLRSILGIPESPPNPSQNPGLPVQVAGPDGKPLIMDMGQVIDWQKFQANERRSDELHTEFIKTAQTVRENVPDGIKAILAAVEETKGGGETEAKTSASQPKAFKCGDCGTEFGIPADWQGQSIKCPTSLGGCGRVYTKEELLA